MDGSKRISSPRQPQLPQSPPKGTDQNITGTDSQGRSVVKTGWEQQQWVRTALFPQSASTESDSSGKASPKDIVRRTVTVPSPVGQSDEAKDNPTIFQERHNLFTAGKPTEETLKEEGERILAEMPDVDLQNARLFFLTLQVTKLQGHDKAKPYLALEQQLLEHFKNSGYIDRLQVYQDAVIEDVLGHLLGFEGSSEEKAVRDALPPRSDIFNGYLYQQEKIINNPPLFAGDLEELISQRALSFLRLIKGHDEKFEKLYQKIKNELNKDVEATMKTKIFLQAESDLVDISSHRRAFEELEKAEQKWQKTLGKIELARYELSKTTYSDEEREEIEEYLQEKLEKVEWCKQEYERLLQLAQPGAEIQARLSKAYHTLTSHLTRRWTPDLLQDSSVLPASFTKVTQGLMECSRLRYACSQMHQAKLEHIKQQHDKAPNHPLVVIEGGGPIGLLQGLKAYEAGADVTLLEQRDTRYERPQIVRLDAQWVNDLRYYLGDQFDVLFNTLGGNEVFTSPREKYQTGFGRIIFDFSGSAHITIKYLEDALHQRLSELIALDQQDQTQTPHIQRLAAHQITGIQPPEAEGKPHRITYQYDPKHDPSLSEEEQAKASVINKTAEAEILIAAGGKHSTLRNTVFSPAAMTAPQQYGVVTWEGTDRIQQPYQLEENLQLVMPMTKDFLTQYHSNLLDTLNPVNGTIGAQLSDEARMALGSVLQLDKAALDAMVTSTPMDGEPDSALYKEEQQLREQLQQKAKVQGTANGVAQPLRTVEGQVLQMRTFENLNHNYLGMEIPDAVQNWFENTGRMLSEANCSKAEQQAVTQVLKEVWFQSVADFKGITKHLGALPEKMNHNFAATFPLQQENLSSYTCQISDQNGGKDLVVLPAGDAATTPHFLSASGLSGGRATGNVANDYISKVAQGQSDQQLKQALEQAESENQRVSEYVLWKGHNFLPANEQDAVNKARYQRTLEQLQQLQSGGTQTATFTVERSGVSENTFILKHGKVHYTISIDNEGWIVAHQKGTPKESSQRYATFNQFQLGALGIAIGQNPAPASTDTEQPSSNQELVTSSLGFEPVLYDVSETAPPLEFDSLGFETEQLGKNILVSESDTDTDIDSGLEETASDNSLSDSSDTEFSNTDLFEPPPPAPQQMKKRDHAWQSLNFTIRNSAFFEDSNIEIRTRLWDLVNTFPGVKDKSGFVKITMDFVNAADTTYGKINTIHRALAPFVDTGPDKGLPL